MLGIELHGDWLQYYEWADLPRDPETKKWKLKLFMGIDPAISLSDKADRFAMALIGVDERGQVYLIEQYADRIPFPEQVNKVIDWYSKWRDKGLQIIGIESNAYQAALEQQISQLGPVAPIIPVISKGKKQERIMRMSPLFRIGKVKIRHDHRDFIEEWVNYDTTLKNSKDDCLDSVEIALASAGALLPELPHSKEYDPNRPVSDINELARLSLPGGPLGQKEPPYDPEMGADW
jgi:predicted phage terminase large subunit-like protein